MAINGHSTIIVYDRVITFFEVAYRYFFSEYLYLGI